MKVSISNLHHQSSDWTRELDFYKEEISVLTKRLEEVASKNSSKEIAAQVEHFQNKFIMLREQIDVLKHDVKEREHKAEQLAKERPDHISEKFYSANDELHNRMKDMSKSFSDTRFEFNGFLAKVM